MKRQDYEYIPDPCPYCGDDIPGQIVCCEEWVEAQIWRALPTEANKAKRLSVCQEFQIKKKKL